MDRSKNKLKAEINKAVQTVTSIIKPTSQIRQILQKNHRDSLSEKMEKVHQTMVDTQTGQQFILCEYNKDTRTGNYRSPYTNKYYPVHNQQTPILSPLLRDLQEKGNLLFEQYARLYYGDQGCISNFYVFETEQGLNFAFFVKKIYKDAKFYGVWCSSNLVQIRGDPSKSVSYKIQSSVLYELNILNEATKQMTELYGSLKKNRMEAKKWTAQYEIDEFHLIVTGKLIEEIQTALRQQIESVFIGKTKQILFKTRFQYSKELQNEKKARAKHLSKIRSENAKVIDL